MYIVKNSNEISTLINLQNNKDVISRKCCDGKTHHVGPILCYVQVRNFQLSRVPRSWTGRVQMKSSTTFIKGNKYVQRERERYFKNGGVVKR